MKMNILKIERFIRVISGLFLVSCMFWGPSNVWFVFGVIPLATGIVGMCPIYCLFNRSKCERTSENDRGQGTFL